MVSRHQVLSYYRQLLRLIGRLPLAQATAARDEARRTIRARSNEADPEQALKHVKELAAKISFLRMTTPRPPGEPVDSGHFVYRDGSWVEDEGKDKGTRVADGSISMEEARQRNAAHYERFYGKPMPRKMFF